MDINNIFQSKIFKIIIFVLLGLIIFLFIFRLGMEVGFRKARFSFQWGENYHQNFAGPRGGFMKDFRREFKGGDFMESHGVVGQIIKIDGSEIVIKGRDVTEKIIVVQDNTQIQRFRDILKVTDLKVDDQIIVIGEPNDKGLIIAKLIRVMPPSPPMPPPVR